MLFLILAWQTPQNITITEQKSPRFPLFHLCIIVKSTHSVVFLTHRDVTAHKQTHKELKEHKHTHNPPDPNSAPPTGRLLTTLISWARACKALLEDVASLLTAASQRAGSFGSATTSHAHHTDMMSTVLLTTVPKTVWCHVRQLCPSGKLFETWAARSLQYW